MTEPKRLLDDPEIGALLRRDLETAKQASSSYDVERGVDRHMALVSAGVIGIVGGAAANSTAPAAASGASATATGSLTAVKAAVIGKGIWIAAGLGIAAAIGAGTTYAITHHDEPTAVVQPSQPDSVKKASPQQTAPTMPAVVDHDLDNPIDPSTLPIPQTHANDPAKKIVQPAKPAAQQVDDEVTTYTKARSLAANDPQGALAILTDSEKRFEGGVLAEEREALTIQCLARLNRDAEAKTRAEAFLKAHPTSPQAERVRHDAKL